VPAPLWRLLVKSDLKRRSSGDSIDVWSGHGSLSLSVCASRFARFRERSNVIAGDWGGWGGVGGVEGPTLGTTLRRRALEFLWLSAQNLWRLYPLAEAPRICIKAAQAVCLYTQEVCAGARGWAPLCFALSLEAMPRPAFSSASAASRICMAAL
jgi:hypothetical protein